MTNNILNPEIESKITIDPSMKRERKLHRVTFDRSSANPGEVLRIELPSFDNDMVFIPNSFKLLFNLQVDVGDDKNHVVFNVSRNLVDTFSVKFGKHTICDIHRYDLYEGYHDLLKVDQDMMMGITSEAYRKIRAGTSDKSTDVKMVKHCNVFGKTYQIPLSHPIIDDHGCFL